MTTAYVRPSRDIYDNGSTTYSTGSTGWNLIDEEVLDTGDYVAPYPQSGGRCYVAGFDAAAVAEVAGVAITSVKVGGRADWCQGWWETPAGAASTKFLEYLNTWDAENWTGDVLTTCPWTGLSWTSETSAIVGCASRLGPTVTTTTLACGRFISKSSTLAVAHSPSTPASFLFDR